ncbi:hypothetical protein C8J57DRAFT_71863 [Mycena rebaudengoi]|nr:hypothetical protein C8J57DRAFT_71863 [Mycena rebaudengoi]
MSTGISLHKASLIALVLETFNFGIFTVLFGATIWVIFQKRSLGSGPYLLPTVCLAWLLSTAHWIIDVVRAVSAFLDSPSGALAYYADISNPLQGAKTAIYVTLTLTCDFFVIYRCYIVWDRKWYMVVLPVLLWNATGAIGYATTYAFLRTKEGGIFLEALVPLVTSFICLTLSTNVVCTALIAYRVMKTQIAHHQHNSGSSRVYSALIIFLESAAIYSSALIVLVVVYLLNSNAQFIVLDLTAPLIGIAFCLIILRLSVATTEKTASRAGISPNASYGGNYPLRSLTVSRVVEVEMDGRDYGPESKSRMPKNFEP